MFRYVCSKRIACYVVQTFVECCNHGWQTEGQACFRERVAASEAVEEQDLGDRFFFVEIHSSQIYSYIGMGLDLGIWISTYVRATRARRSNIFKR